MKKLNTIKYKGICNTEGCTRNKIAKGLCNTCYVRVRYQKLKEHES